VACIEKYITSLWYTESGGLIYKIFTEATSARSICFSKDGKLLLTSYRDDYIVGIPIDSLLTYNGFPTANELSKIWFSEGTDVLTISAYPFGKFIAIGNNENNIHFWSFESQKLMRTLEGHKDGVTSISFSPDGKYLASGSEDRTVTLVCRSCKRV